LAVVLAFVLTGPVRPAAAQVGNLTLNKYKAESGMGAAFFPHWAHRLRFTCNVCHDAIFQMEAGHSDMLMDELRAGRFCGRCHNGRIAWDTGVQNCSRCHRLE
jgi:c(7)-type cytochrome triheme protein